MRPFPPEKALGGPALVAVLVALLGCRSAESFPGMETNTGTGGKVSGSGGAPPIDGGSGGDRGSGGTTTGSGGDTGSGGSTTGSGGSATGGASGTGGSAPAEDAAPMTDVPPADSPNTDSGPPPIDVPADSGADTGPEAKPDVPDSGPRPEPNLVGYWKFDEGTGTLAHDSSGHGNDAAIRNVATWNTATLPPLKFGNPSAIVLDATASATDLTPAALPNTNAPQTVSAWINLRSTAGGDQYAVCLWNPNSSGVSLGVHNGLLSTWKWGPGVLVSVNPPALNSWHHVAYTFDGTTHKLYLDGDAPVTSTVAPNAAPVTRLDLGNYNSVSSWNGQLDDVRIYDVALSAAAIARLAAGEASSLP